MMVFGLDNDGLIFVHIRLNNKTISICCGLAMEIYRNIVLHKNVQGLIFENKTKYESKLIIIKKCKHIHKV